MERREFLKLMGIGTAATFVPGVGRLLAQEREKTRAASAATNTLVVIYQRGGMDTLNALVPYGDKRYRDLRPTIAIPEANGDDGPGMIKLDSMFGLHPSLQAVKPYWDSKKLAIVVNTGSPSRTRSHFDAQDFMEYAAPDLRTVRNGWLNRYLQATKKKDQDESVIRAVAMQGLLPRALRGDCPVLAVPEKHVLDNEKVMDSFGEIYRSDAMEEREEDPVVQSGRDTLETLKRYKAIVDARTKERSVKYPGGRTAQKLRDIASLIHADCGLEVAALDIGGWDHHANEGGNEGVLANMLKDLAEALAAFAADLGDRIERTLVLVMTEFGRTCAENGNRGTDHGHGGLMFLLGGGVKGGKVHGKWTGLEEKALYQGRDLPVHTDFRDVFATVLKEHLKFDPPKNFFPNYSAGEVKGLF